LSEKCVDYKVKGVRPRGKEGKGFPILDTERWARS